MNRHAPPAEVAPLRIAYLLSQYPVPTQTFARSDIEALRQLGHEVTVFTMKPARGLGGTGEIDRPSLRGMLRWPAAMWRCRGAMPRLLRAIARGFARTPRSALMALACLPRAAEIADRIVQGRHDVVHLFWARHAGLALPMLEARRAPALRSVFVGAYDLVTDDFVVRLALGSAQFAVSHAEVNRSYLAGMAAPGTPTAIIPRGIPLMPLDRDAVRDPALWVTGSALVPEKNVAGVLAAFANARRCDERLRLEVYGDGPDRARLIALADRLGCSAPVTFAGHVAREDLFRAMQRADTFVLLSKKPSERLPNVVKEALWAGCFVISSNSPGIGELLTDDGLGSIVDPDDGDAVARAAAHAVTRDRGTDAGRIARARAHIAAGFSAEGSMAEYAMRWRSAIEGIAPKPRTAGALAA